MLRHHQSYLLNLEDASAISNSRKSLSQLGQQESVVSLKLSKEPKCWAWAPFVYKIGTFKGPLLGTGNSQVPCYRLMHNA